MVSQEQFIAVNCFLRYGTLPRLMIIETWIKILDPYGYGKLPRHFYMDFFEKLARGKLTLISTIVSSSFAQQIVSFMEQKGCVSPDNGEINIKVLTKKLIDKEIDIELFNQTLKSVNDLDVPESKPITDFSFLEDLIATIVTK